MRYSSAWCFVLLCACSSEEAGQAVPSGGGTPAAGRAGAGTGGRAGDSGGVPASGRSGGGAGALGGEASTGGAPDAGEDGQGGESGGQAGMGEAGEGGAGGAPDALTYRLTGSAEADLESGQGGSGGEASPEAPAGAPGSGEAGAGGGAELPIIDRVMCSIAVELVDVIEEADGGLSGIAVGEVFRNVYSGKRRWEFSAFVAGPATLTVRSDSIVELRAFGDQTGAKPFWRELEVLEGERIDSTSYSGAWTCTTLALADPGFPDVEGDAAGTWQLEPAN